MLKITDTFKFFLSQHDKLIWQVFSIVILLSVLVVSMTDKLWLMGIPFLMMLLFATTVNVGIPYYLLFFLIPVSTEVNFSNGFSTDFPTEPLIVFLMFAYIFYVLQNMRDISSRFFRHPLTLLIIFHVIWIGISCLHSYNTFVSVKVFLAKIFYVITFYFLSGLLLKKVHNMKILFWSVMIPLTMIVLLVLGRHAALGFTFKEVNHIFAPFFRNHVSYSGTLSLFYPFIFFALFWYKKWSYPWIFLFVSMFIFFAAIQLSFTRASMVGIFIAAAFYFVIKFRLMKLAIGVGLISIFSIVLFLRHNNNYLGLAPDYEKTVTHQNFENLLEATYKLEDISTMERVYRWVAGSQMILKEPIFGFGPGNFYSYYKSYAVSSFKTYVSYNPEKSGIHCYFLMIWVEQGLIGFLIFLLLIVYALLKGESVYHQLKTKKDRLLLMSVMLCLISILCLILINDMIETDKVGSFFFMCLAVITNLDLSSQGLLQGSVTAAGISRVEADLDQS